MPPPVPFRVRALYDYKSDYPDDLNFTAETTITVSSIEDDEWYSGSYTNSTTGEVHNGIFPQNFVEVINEPAIPATRPRPKQAVLAEQEEKGENEVQQLTTEGSKKEDEDFVERTKESAKEESGKSDVISQDPLPSQETSSKQSIDKDKEIEELESEAKNASESNITVPQQKAQTISSASSEKTAIESSKSQPEALAAPSAKPKKNNAFFNKIAAFDNQNAAPILPTKKPKEESYVKKPFYGAGKSSYIPSGFGSRKKYAAAPPPPSSISPPSSAHSSSQPSVPNISAGTSATNDDDESASTAIGSVVPVESEEQDQPKLSLKERIALLRKRQEEEAEREAALAKKKVEKKKKKTLPVPAPDLAVASATAPSSISDSASAPLPSQEAPPVPSAPSSGPPEVPQPQLSSSSEDFVNGSDGAPEDSAIGAATLTGEKGVKEENGISGATKEHQSGAATKEQLEIENDTRNPNKDASKDNEEEEEEEDEEDEDPEEARRRALRERMAKLSGGAGMFGMMGMNPFGQSASSSKKKQVSKPKLEEDDRVNKEKEDEEIPRAIPILPGFNTGQNQPSMPGIPIPGIPTPGSTLNAADSKLDEDVPSPVSNKQAPAPPQTKKTEQEDYEKSATPKSPSTAEVKSNSDVSSNVSEIKDELDVESFNSASDKEGEEEEEEEFDKNADTGDANEGTPLFAVESKKSEATEIPAITDEDKLENSVEPSEPSVRPDTSEVAQATTAASLAQTVKPLLNASYSDYPSAKQAKQKAEQQGHPVAIDKNKVTSDGETTGYEGDEDTELPIQHNDEQHQQHQVPVPQGVEVPPVRRTSTSLSNASINRRPSNASTTSKGAPPPIPSQAPPFIPPVPVPGITHASTTGSAPSAPPPSLPPHQQQQQQQQHLPSAPSHAAPVPPSSVAPPVPPVPAPVSKSYTLPESAERGSGSSSNKRDSIINNNRQSIDSFRRASIDSYRSGDYVVERTRSNLLSASSTNNSNNNNNRDTYQVTSGVSDKDIDVYESPDWWLKNELPPTLFAQVDKTLIFEVDESKMQKRKGVNLIVRDFYILFAFDYRQKLISVTFDEADTSNVSFQIIDIAPTAPQSQTNDDSTGLKLYQLAAKYNGHSIEESQHAFVVKLFHEIPDILSPIGLESFGKLVYINESQKNINQVDEFQPGDVLRVANAKFQGHNKLHQKIVYEVGVSLPLVAVITEFDNHKLKFRVLEKDPKNRNKVKAVSYKITDLLSGSIKVFRPVNRSFVGW